MGDGYLVEGDLLADDSPLIAKHRETLSSSQFMLKKLILQCFLASCILSLTLHLHLTCFPRQEVLLLFFSGNSSQMILDTSLLKSAQLPRRGIHIYLRHSLGPFPVCLVMVSSLHFIAKHTNTSHF